MEKKLVEIHVSAFKTEARVDSRVLADFLGKSHKAVIQLITTHKDRFKTFGPLAFQMAKGEPLPQGGFGKSTRYALLNEDQSWLLLAFSKNTERVADLKVELVKAFSRFRQNRQTESDYLPFYHELHDAVKFLSDHAHLHGSTTNEKLFHINFNRLINTAFGLESGQRQSLPGHLRAIVTVANIAAKNAIEEAILAGLDHHAAYAAAKGAIQSLATIATPRLEGA